MQWGSVEGATVSEVAQLVAAVAWPLVVAAAVWWLRRPLGVLVGRLTQNLKKLSIGPVAVELQEVSSSVTPGFAAIVETVNAYELGPSFKSRLAEELAKSEPLPYAVVDLGTGKRWLTSRLYLFTALLSRVRGLETIIFVDAPSGVHGHFVGISEVDRLDRALARSEPWLEVNLMAAYDRIFRPYVDTSVAGAAPGAPMPGLPVAAPPPASEERGMLYQQVASTFLEGIQLVPEAGAAPNVGPPPAPDGWTMLSGKQGDTVLEHASWISGSNIQPHLGDALDRFAYIVEERPTDAASRTLAVLGVLNRDHVVVVDGQRTFKRILVKRREALERLAAQTAGVPEPARVEPA
jgi:hypothetical protein